MFLTHCQSVRFHYPWVYLYYILQFPLFSPYFVFLILSYDCWLQESDPSHSLLPYMFLYLWCCWRIHHLSIHESIMYPYLCGNIVLLIISIFSIINSINLIPLSLVILYRRWLLIVCLKYQSFPILAFISSSTNYCILLLFILSVILCWGV